MNVCLHRNVCFFSAKDQDQVLILILSQFKESLVNLRDLKDRTLLHIAGMEMSSFTSFLLDSKYIFFSFSLPKLNVVLPIAVEQRSFSQSKGHFQPNPPHASKLLRSPKDSWLETILLFKSFAG